MTCFRTAALFSLAGLLGASRAPRPAAPRPTALFPIVVQGRWGFIDSTGAVVIAPRFDQVQPFSEGLAAVREAGYYGYLNSAGHLVMPPAYAYAAPFRQGYATVLRTEKPQLINLAGQPVALPAAYKDLRWQPGLDQGGVWVGTLASGEWQVLSPQGLLLNPATFSSVGKWSNNRLVVQQQPWKKTPTGIVDEPVAGTGVLDAHGQWVIPYRRFAYISTFQNGLALAARYQAASDTLPTTACLIDTTGQVVAQLPESQDFDRPESNGFADGAAIVRLSFDGKAPGFNDYNLGAIDRQGHLLFRLAGWRQLSAFSHGRAWAQDSAQHWHLLDKAGRPLNTVPIARVLRPDAAEQGPAFADGAELVALADDGGYAALDHAGRIISRLARPRFGANEPRQVGSILTFSGADSQDRQGFWNWRTGQLVSPRFSEVSPLGYVHGLLAVVEDNRLGYLTPAGRYAWRAARAASAPLNVDYMRRSFYQVASATQLAHYASLGGWYQSPNTAKPATGAPTPGRLTVQVEPSPRPGAFDATTMGHRLAITNASADTAVFDAQDSSLYLTVQAQDAEGQWRSIEYSPSSFCGNSYHQVFLAPGQSWQLVVPAYRGGLRTQLRVQLVQREEGGDKKPLILYSNTFAGSVNPAQFWRQPGYQPQGIMDPYTN